MTRQAWRAVHPDLRSSHGYRWPFPPNEAVAPLPAGEEFTRGNPCPQFPGDGLCLAKTWRGAASGSIPAITCLLVEYDEADVLGEDDDKLRVSRCRVVDVFDAPALLRAGFGARADLAGADLTGANLAGANLDGAYLDGAYLTGADLAGAYLAGADLTGADLTGANLAGADLTGANLYRANLYRAYLDGAYLYRADLAGANLYRANLTRANLTRANLYRAYLTRANLDGANLTRANLDGANLDGAYLDGAIAGRFTRWPDPDDPAARGVTVR